MERQFAEYSQNNAQQAIVAGYRRKNAAKGSLDGALRQDTDAEFANHLQDYQHQRQAGPAYAVRAAAAEVDMSR